MYNEPAVIIIPNGAGDGEDKIIGPFTTGDAASDWGFKNLEYGTEWYWVPMIAPVMRQ